VREETTSLDALARSVFARCQEFTAKVMEALVKQRYRQDPHQKTPPCLWCGCLLPVRALVPWAVETLAGQVSLDRPYLYCLECKRGIILWMRTLSPD
jgi:hypothetical protein